MLGLIPAMVMSRMEVAAPESDSQYSDGLSPLLGERIIGTYSVESSSYFALLYVLPSIGAEGFVVYLIFMVPQREVTYKTSKLNDIDSFGTERTT